MGNDFDIMYLVDGDNHVYEGLEGLDRLDQVNKFGKVRIFVTQPELKDKLIKRYGNRPYISVKMVKSGKDAVDNQIKSTFGNIMKNRRPYQKIYIISRDKGYSDLISKYRDEYGVSSEELSVRESIEDCWLNIIFFVDGSKHIYKSLEGLDQVKVSDKVYVFVSQSELKNKLIKEYGKCITVKEVSHREKDAVANEIKIVISNMLKNRKPDQKYYIIR